MYTSYQHFRDDEHRHCIAAGSEFDWDQSADQDMYGWEVDYVERFVNPVAPAATKGPLGAKGLIRKFTVAPKVATNKTDKANNSEVAIAKTYQQDATLANCPYLSDIKTKDVEKTYSDFTISRNNKKQ